MIDSNISKRVINNLKTEFVDYLIDNEGIREYKENAKWLSEWLTLDDSNYKDMLNNVEASQSKAIVEAMSNRDGRIFVNQLGLFYIKQTTKDYYDLLSELTNDVQLSDEDFEKIKQQAIATMKNRAIARSKDVKKWQDPKKL